MDNAHTLIKHLTEKVGRLEKEVHKLNREKTILKELLDYYEDKVTKNRKEVK